MHPRRAVITLNLLPLCCTRCLQDWKVSRDCRGVQCVDGSFPDFFAGVNCDLLQCGGEAVVFDYFDVSEAVCRVDGAAAAVQQLGNAGQCAFEAALCGWCSAVKMLLLGM